jgi:tetratricopeptide (TPR) repeat protein
MASRLFVLEGPTLDISTPSDAAPSQTKRSALLEMIDLGRERERALADLLNADARTAAGTVERWAPKDHFVHLAVWAAYQARRLEAAATGNAPTQPADNDTVFLEHRDDPWETTWAALMRACDDAAAAVTRASDEQLTIPRPNGRTLLSLTINNFYLHPIAHVAQLHEELGDAASAEQVQQEAVATMARLFGKGDHYANAIYNLGCYYALRGQSAEAIAQVREALAVNPTLTDLSKEDGDLVSLRELPEYQALYTA